MQVNSAQNPTITPNIKTNPNQTVWYYFS